MISITKISKKESILPERLYLMLMAFKQNGHSLMVMVMGVGFLYFQMVSFLKKQSLTMAKLFQIENGIEKVSCFTDLIVNRCWSRSLMRMANCWKKERKSIIGNFLIMGLSMKIMIMSLLRQLYLMIPVFGS